MHNRYSLVASGGLPRFVNVENLLVADNCFKMMFYGGPAILRLSHVQNICLDWYVNEL